MTADIFFMREGFKSFVGEYPEDVLGEDWERCLEDYLDDSEVFHEGHLRGSCQHCKMD